MELCGVPYCEAHRNLEVSTDGTDKAWGCGEGVLVVESDIWF